MSDSAFQLLVPHLENSGATNTLLFADENLLDVLPTLQQHDHLLVITNRWDIYQQAISAQLNCEFSDMDCSQLSDGSFDRILYRVSKEKPLVNHLIREAFRLLKTGGELFLAGKKNDGAKTYIDKAGKLFGAKAPAQKFTSDYLGCVAKSCDISNEKALKALDDKDYTDLRCITQINDKAVLSKPGQFGWNKLDKGSELLIEVADDYLQTKKLKPESLLDLGCGYGYLTLNSYRWPSITRRVATDNNAAALLSVEANADSLSTGIEVVADDCGASIKERFDLILCNPPFHQGFDVDGDLTTKFLSRIHTALTKNGMAIVVTNQFIPIVSKAAGKFSNIKTLSDDGSFKVTLLDNNRRR